MIPETGDLWEWKKPNDQHKQIFLIMSAVDEDTGIQRVMYIYDSYKRQLPGRTRELIFEDHHLCNMRKL